MKQGAGAVILSSFGCSQSLGESPVPTSMRLLSAKAGLCDPSHNSSLQEVQIIEQLQGVKQSRKWS